MGEQGEWEGGAEGSSCKTCAFQPASVSRSREQEQANLAVAISLRLLGTRVCHTTTKFWYESRTPMLPPTHSILPPIFDILKLDTDALEAWQVV